MSGKLDDKVGQVSRSLTLLMLIHVVVYGQTYSSSGFSLDNGAGSQGTAGV